MAKRLLEGEALMKRAQELGVNTDSGNFVNIAGKGSVPLPAPEYEIQRRILEAERHIREHKLWVVALVSAIASVISAVAAWVAVARP